MSRARGQGGAKEDTSSSPYLAACCAAEAHGHGGTQPACGTEQAAAGQGQGVQGGPGVPEGAGQAGVQVHRGAGGRCQGGAGACACLCTCVRARARVCINVRAYACVIVCIFVCTP